MIRRRKRAAPEDLYRTCKAAGTCPDDIINKIEGNTLADRILKWGSVGVFFGGLGIGTGRGTGGSTGYVPLGRGTGGVTARPGGTPNIVRPSISVDAVGPGEAITLDSLGPSLAPPRPSVVEDPYIDPAAVGPSDPSVIELTDVSSGRGDTLTPNEIDVVAEVSPAGPTDTVESAVNVNEVSVNTSPAIVEVTAEGPPIRTSTSSSNFHNPAFDILQTPALARGETSGSVHVYVTSGEGGYHVGGEDIPLQTFSSEGNTFDTSVDTSEGFRASTPTGRPPRARLGLFSRRYQQVNVGDPRFLGEPQQLVTFDNPVYDPDLTIDFGLPEGSTAAPDAAFTDIRVLHRPRYSLSRGGLVRLSRVGQRASMHTRSGAVIGQEVHYFTELSPVARAEAPGEALEMSVLGEHSGNTVIIHSDSESFESVALDEYPESYADSDLLDVYESVGENSQLVIGSGRRSAVSVTPYGGSVKKAFPSIFDGFAESTVDSSRPTHPVLPPIVPSDGPVIIIDFTSSSWDFDLHPSLLRRKRRKLFF
nr:MAG: L2 protein [Hydrurga leptonyx papillomavirus 2]